MRSLAPLLLAAGGPLTLGACEPSPPSARPGPVFDPIAFFSGRTRGDGRLSILLRRTRPVTVEGRGRVRADGVLTLDQRVEREGSPASTRRWRIRRTGPGRYAGTLSDAAGPVAGEVEGNRLRLRFKMTGGYDAEQWLTLSPDGRVAQNRMTVSRFGLRVAKLDETIRKLDR